MTRSIGLWAGVRLDVARVVAALCVWPGVVSASAADQGPLTGRTTLVVRVYDGAGLAARDLREASRVASDILRAGGVDLRWKTCPRLLSDADASGCRQPLAANEAVLRLIQASTTMSAEPTALGFTLLDSRGRQAVLSTVFMDRVDDVARRAKIETTLLTGRAMAHELGHLLLGTPGHGDAGLMRAFWSDDALRSQSDADWHLLPAEMDAIRAGRVQPALLDVAGGS
ncbi:MAG TPA: hypothetical protein VM032_05325 [Vicinamibacterales bacterium]|nr:hypothetical protein [Vicinamibacterales bacterium]